MTRMVRCPVEGCFNLMPGDATDCGNHQRNCVDCGDPLPQNAHHMRRLCTACQKSHKKAADRECHGIGDSWAKPPKPKEWRWPVRKPIMSDRAQKKIEAVHNARWAAESAHGPCRTLSRAEIEALAPNIAQPGSINKGDYNGIPFPY